MFFHFCLIITIIGLTFILLIKSQYYIQTRKLLLGIKKYSSNNDYDIYIDTIKMMFDILKQTMIQSLFRALKKNEDGTHELMYYHGGIKYVVPIMIGKVKFRPPVQIDFYTKIGEIEHQINSFIVPYAGPNYNFHHLPITPHYLGINNLIIKVDDEVHIVYKEKEIIVLTI